MKWAIYTLGTLAVGFAGIIIYEVYQCRLLRRLADNRLRLLRRVIGLSYLYKNQPMVFSQKFYNEIQVEKLKDAGIIPHNHHFARLCHNENELFLCGLIDAGFSRKELCVIFDLKSINCFYVKFHRIKKRLRKLGMKMENIAE